MRSVFRACEVVWEDGTWVLLSALNLGINFFVTNQMAKSGNDSFLISNQNSF